MEKIFKNRWSRSPGDAYERCGILDHSVHPEGLDINRLRCLAQGKFRPDNARGHIVTVLRGGGMLDAAEAAGGPFALTEGTHLYLPPGSRATLAMHRASELLCVSGASGEQARGDRLLIRDETFLAACATESQMLRWVFTPQYLSRRVFLHHDPALLSKSGNPVSWFRTTMFDVTGLPCNDEGQPVFKMSYNSRTECNVCYDVRGEARVRMAKHPYGSTGQTWWPWLPLDGESNYHLNETAGGADEERRTDAVTGEVNCLRNKHEVSITGGHVTLCCLFDPAPTGVERHRPGEYSDYVPLPLVIGTDEYRRHRQTISSFDEMVDVLSAARANGTLDRHRGSWLWKLYEEGREAQAAAEARVLGMLSADGIGRRQVIAAWMQPRGCRVTDTPSRC